MKTNNPAKRPDFVPQRRHAERVKEVIGVDGGPRAAAYSLLLSLSSHALSAMRELIGMPERVIYAAQHDGGRFLSAAFDYGHFTCHFEAGVDRIPHFDAHLEVYTPTEIIRVDYDTPYVRHPAGAADEDWACDKCRRFRAEHVPDAKQLFRRGVARFPPKRDGKENAKDDAQGCPQRYGAGARHGCEDGVVAAKRMDISIGRASLSLLRNTPPQVLRAMKAGGRRLADVLQSNSPESRRSALQSFVDRIDVHPDHISIAINRRKLSSLLGLPEAGSTGTETAATVSGIHLPLRLKRRGIEAKLVVGGEKEPVSNPDTALIALIAKAHRWCDQMTDGSTASITDLAVRENEDRNEISRHLPLAFLAPDIVEKILKGIQPVDLTVEKLRRLSALPYRWDEQRAVLGFTA